MFKCRGLCVFPFSRALHPLPHLLCFWHACTFWLLFFLRAVSRSICRSAHDGPLRLRGFETTLCAIPSLLFSHFLSHIQNGHLYFYPTLASERDCVPAFASLIPGYCLDGKSRRVSPSRRQLAAPILSQIWLIFAGFCPPCFPAVWGQGQCSNLTELKQHVCAFVVCIHICVWAGRGRTKRHWTILETSGPISAHLFRDPEKLSSLPHMAMEWKGTIDNCGSIQLQFVCAPDGLLMVSVSWGML